MHVHSVDRSHYLSTFLIKWELKINSVYIKGRCVPGPCQRTLQRIEVKTCSWSGTSNFMPSFNNRCIVPGWRRHGEAGTGICLSGVMCCPPPSPVTAGMDGGAIASMLCRSNARPTKGPRPTLGALSAAKKDVGLLGLGCHTS